MLRAALFGLLAVVVAAFNAQVPLDSIHHLKDDYPAIYDDNAEWSLDQLPNPNATDHLVFETVYSFLQHWPNTRMRNGHNIVPGIIPKGTLLYHGTGYKEIPPGPEWVAADPELAYYFCRNDSWESRLREGCWFLTLTTTRPLKIVYFDGSSAAKVPGGSMDTQDLIVWGESRPGGIFDELQRIQDFCAWGKKFGLDGIVRMSVVFEVMLCDFAVGVSVVSFVNLERLVQVPFDTSDFVPFEAVNAGSHHNYFPGETRVQLDLARLVSFYDTRLVPSLVAIRAGQERWDHRVRNTSSEDLSAVKSTLEAILRKPSRPSSGIDWKALMHVIVDRFAGRLELTRHLLNPSATNSDMLDLARKTQTQLRVMLTPFILFSTSPTNPANKTDLDWTKPIYGLCATAHTYFMQSRLDTMTDSEKLILQAVRGTNREICRVVTRMWAAGVYAGLDISLNTKTSPDIAEVTHVWSRWVEDLNDLMAWLDWSVWIKCNPSCGPEEMCYLPTWPFGFYDQTRLRLDRVSGPRVRPKELSDFDLPMAMESLAEDTNPNQGEWIRPQPKCITQVVPYAF